jgi:2,5-diketo-D-gluconate reductase A
MNLGTIGIGVGVGGFDYNSTYNSVLNALKIGYRLIDTAENYYNEEAVGNAIIDSGIERNEIIIISKYFGGINYGNNFDVINSFNESLKKLKTNYIDIYLVHMPFGCKWGNNEWEPIIEDKFINYKKRLSVWFQFIDLKKRKLVNHIGVSNWTLENINEIKLNKLHMPEAIQIEWCPYFYDKSIYNYCISNSIKIFGYGLFSTNSINNIEKITLNESTKHPSQILIKWCSQKNVISIIRSNNFKNLLDNFNTSEDTWKLCADDMLRIDSVSQVCKGHCLNTVYDKNYKIHFWEPLIIDDFQFINSDNDCIQDLINGHISCIIVKNAISTNDRIGTLTKMQENDLLKEQLPYNNYNMNFRYNEIGITIDNMEFRKNPDKYFNECTRVNNLFDVVFNTDLNPFKIMIDVVKKLTTNKYYFLQNQKNNISCPNGVFRFFSKTSDDFPYHTDGFNYGNVLNKITNLDRNLYPMIMNQDQHNVIGIVLILQQTNDIRNEIDLHNCLVGELELFADEIGMYSHWMGTKYTKNDVLKMKLQNKQFFSPILNSGDLYIFSSSRIHKLNNFISNDNRIVLATFACVKNNEIIFYQ